MVDDKYDLLNESLRAVSEGTINLLILKGLPGCGKTFTTLKYLEENNINYEYINNYSTPLSFYNLLYKKRQKEVLVFDDMLSMNDPNVKSMFKSVCGKLDNGERKVSYHSTTPLLEKNKLPESFYLDEKKANIILIFNEDVSGFEPIINRGVTIDFIFNFSEMIKILRKFQKAAEIDEDVLKYVEETCNEATKNLSIRTLVMLSNLKKNGYDFKKFSKEVLKTDSDVKDLLELDEKSWCDKTGLSRRTYYRNKKSAKVS